jgi:serine/threonine protein kinase
MNFSQTFEDNLNETFHNLNDLYTPIFLRKIIIIKLCAKRSFLSNFLPNYLPNKNHLYQEVDIWAIGLIVYEMFCGGPPFTDEESDFVDENGMPISKNLI